MVSPNLVAIRLDRRSARGLVKPGRDLEWHAIGTSGESHLRFLARDEDGFCVLSEMDSTGSRTERGAGDLAWNSLSNSGKGWRIRGTETLGFTIFMRFWQ